MKIKFIDAEQVHASLDYKGLVDALRKTFKEGVDVLDRFHLQEPLKEGGENNWIFLPAWQFGKFQGVKIVSVFPGNEKRGIASIQGVYLLFDGSSGLPVACMDGAAITLRKTAANSALAATYLARTESSKLLMVGAGELAPYLISAHCTVRPIAHVKIWNRTRTRAEKLLASMLADPATPKSLTIEVTDDLEAAAREADVISCATMSVEPLIKGAWLSKGCHLDLVGGFRPDMREADDDAVRAARIFVDTRMTTVSQSGDISQPIAEGMLTESEITDTFQLARGERHGRRSAHEITLFKSGGGGQEDLGAAKYLLDKLGIFEAGRSN
jgi:ornithine cyclodeaminase